MFQSQLSLTQQTKQAIEQNETLNGHFT